ncbi:cell division/cell wall cluster transcriptional repressor MraZ [Candidatus Saccharibacteria bacterium]|nr:cell division/cell wall cluster transcriptional repressor MraZ [Candidatus Saccharibacteria bacterium]
MDYFERKLDDKNRLTIPKEIRLELGEKIVVTRGFGKYLHLYSERVWNTEMENALKGDILDERTADLNVRFRMGKSEPVMDQKQGRITLEAHQLAYAGIARDVVAVRVGNYWRLTAAETAAQV